MELDTIIEVEILDGAVQLQSLDDPEMQKELHITPFRLKARSTVFQMSVKAARNLIDRFLTIRVSLIGNPGSAHRAASAAIRALEAALASAISKEKP